MSLTLREIEQRLVDLPSEPRFGLIFDLLAAYGHAKSTITRLRAENSTLNKARRDNEVLWKKQLYYRYLEGADDDALLGAMAEAEADEKIAKAAPRFLIVSSGERLLAKDTRSLNTLDTPIKDLVDHAPFFAPWAKIEKTAIENVNPADIKAAGRMAKLYDEIVKVNEVKTDDQIHALNVFFARLLFCLFAEDTGVFEPQGLFSNTVASHTVADGSDMASFLDDLFAVLDTPLNERDGVRPYFKEFGYVNGKLFSERTPTPRFSRVARAIVLECAELDWSAINPDIFGSMIQAVVHPSQRESLGMHYTSVENIMKVLRPLFLDELEEAWLDAQDSEKKLRKLLDRIARIKVFDPACGSGNFLITAYKELRALEHRILLRLHELESGSLGGSSAGPQATLFPEPRVRLENFYGIEIDDFAHEIAMLSLWFAKHQMNLKYRELFDTALPLIPLRDAGRIVHGNATRLDWEGVCPVREGDEVFVCGNPPYLGARQQSRTDKDDLRAAFAGERFDSNLDYVCGWLNLGAKYVRSSDARLGFVATSSISQGLHIASLWPHLLCGGVRISFCHTPFPWSNQAKGNAGVTVVIVGLDTRSESAKIYSGSEAREVAAITPYLTAGTAWTAVSRLPRPRNGLPRMNFGNMPLDGGHLLLAPTVRRQLISEFPEASGFVRRFVGAAEYLNDLERYCLWLPTATDWSRAKSIPLIAERVEQVRVFRSASKDAATRKHAKHPFRFRDTNVGENGSIIVPRVSSERREYIPMGFLGPDTVISDAANAIYDAEPWVFGLIQSRMHMVWVRTVAGRLKTDYRYSAVLCYNTFPVPPLSSEDKQRLTEGAVGILRAREMYSDKTLAELYDPDKMPAPLRDAHRTLDDIVDSLYQQGERKFESDDARLERLFNMYAEATKADGSNSAAGPVADAQPDLAEGGPEQPELVSSAD